MSDRVQEMKRKLAELKEGADVEAILLSLGAEISMSNGEQLRTKCIVHGGNNPTSLVYNRRTKMFRCWGECSFSGDVFELVKEVNKCDFKTAIEYVRRYSVEVPGFGLKEKKEDSPWMRAIAAAYEPKKSNGGINTALVEKAAGYTPNPYVESGKFKQTTIDYFGVGFCNFNDFFMDRAIIPIHDENGLLVGYSGRDMNNGESTNKYRIKKGFKKAYCLYNLNRAIKYLTPSKPLVITEGFGQVWRLHEAGIKRGVALMGKELSQEQLELVLTYTTSVVLALDFDKPGVEATKAIIEKLEGSVDIYVLASPFGEGYSEVDLGDMTPEQVKECYLNRVPYYEWLSSVENKVATDFTE